MTIESHPEHLARSATPELEGSPESDLAVCLDAVSKAPEIAASHYRLGIAYLQNDDFAAAETSLRKALELDPTFPDAGNRLGEILRSQRRFDEAEIEFGKALAENVDCFDLHLNLGTLLADSRRHVEALYHYRRAILLQPDSAPARERIGPLLRDIGRITEAIEHLEKAACLDPALAGAWSDLGTCRILRGELAAADEACLEALRRDPKSLAAGTNRLLIANWQGKDKDETFQLHLDFARQLKTAHGIEPCRFHGNSRDATRPLRVGFVSGDLRRHSVSHFIEGPLARLDCARIQTWAYFSHPREDHRSAELKGLFQEWRDIAGLDDDAAAELIRRDRIDVLIDLSGHTGYGRMALFARQPAPIQASWIGYPNTSGLTTIDYRLTDDFADPPGASERYHTETLVRLPDCFLCYTPPADAPDVVPPPVTVSGHITFGSFNTRVKIGEETLALWSRVLAAVPTARLLIKSATGLSDRDGRNQLLESLGRAGIDPTRVTLHPYAPGLAGHLAKYAAVDICLDTYPYHGTTTTCEALWMGVPVVTLSGDRHASRVGVSLLNNFGLHELIARDSDEYVAIVTRLALDTARLTELRTRLRAQMSASPVLDATAMATKLEGALRKMWDDYCHRPATAEAPVHATVGDHCNVVVRGGHRMSVAHPRQRSVTAWVLLEQEDWFEDELRFVANLCLPHWQAIDIGANHGVYALALAAAGAGMVWAFEPTIEPRQRLRDSVALNRFEDRIAICPLGLSDARKTVDIALSDHSESNSMHARVGHQKGTETIELAALDELVGTSIPAGARIDFVKLDAEGEEAAIIRGGLRFFCEQSPLVMFEIKHGALIDLELPKLFRAMGYSIYRLVSALGCLIPVPEGTESTLDDYTINLFACKSDRALELAGAASLALELTATGIAPDRTWSNALFSLPSIAAKAPPQWCHYGFDEDYGQALLAWCGSRQTSKTPAERYQLLLQAFAHFQAAVSNEDGHPALAVLGIRICADLGDRRLAVALATAFLEQVAADDEFPLDRPLPPAYAKFDRRSVHVDLGKFLYQSIVEFHFDRIAHSRVFTRQGEDLLDRALGNPEHSPRIERSAVLVHARSGTAFTLERSATIFQAAPDNLNADLWLTIAGEFGYVQA